MHGAGIEKMCSEYWGVMAGDGVCCHAQQLAAF